MINAPSSSIDSFLKLESAGGIILIMAALVAIVLANTPLSQYYQLLLSTPVEIRIGSLEIAKPLLLWITSFRYSGLFYSEYKLKH